MSQKTLTDKANEFSMKALDRMHQEKLPPIPEHYELWFVYYSKANPEVTREIDVLVSKKQEITEEKCLEIYNRLLNNSKNDQQIQQAGHTIEQTIKNVSTAVGDVKSRTEKYNTDIESKASSLNENMPVEEMKVVLQGVVSDTQEMIEHNQRLEEQLSVSSEKMTELQRDLEKARKEALTDGLTGVMNRKAFDAEIERIQRECDEDGSTFSMAMMDIDHFKTFNDNYGHQVGDQVLRLVALTLIDGVKGRDIVTRYGGEEFAIILPKTDLSSAVKLADALRKSVENKELVNKNTGDILGRITLSGGVAEYTQGEDISYVIERADNALYTAKHNGRNQIAASPDATVRKAG